MSLPSLVRHQRTHSPGDRHRRTGGRLSTTAARRAKLQSPVSLARRHAAQPAGEPRAAIVQMLGVRHRRRHLQLHDEDGERRISRSPGDAGRAGRHCAEAAARFGGASRPMKSKPLYQAMAWAEERFHQCLLSAPEAEPARRYLAERQISPDSIRKFRLGFAPDRWDWLIKQSMNSEISTKTLGNGWADRSQTRWPRALRSFPGPRAVSDSRCARPPVAVGGRILPQVAADDSCRDCEVHQLARDAAVFQKQHALRAGFRPRCHRPHSVTWS